MIPMCPYASQATQKIWITDKQAKNLLYAPNVQLWRHSQTDMVSHESKHVTYIYV